MKIVPAIDKSFTKMSNFDEALETWVANSFYRLNIYFKEGTMERHQQVVAFSFTDLGSAVGGIAGLKVGASILSFIEIGHLLLIYI